MAQISNFYQESEVTVGTAKYKLSAPLNTIYNVNDELDLSIAQTAWNKQQFFGISPRNSSTEAYNKRVPTTSVTSFTPTLQYKATAAPVSANFYNVAYNPKIGTEQISMYPCIVSGSANCYIGTQYFPDVDPHKTTSNLKVFTDFKYGEILFVTPDIKGWKKSEFSFDNMYSSGNKLTVTSIPWEDFIANPSNYYVVGDVMPASAWIWDGSKYTSNNSVKPAYIINSEWLKGFQIYGFLPDGCEFYTQNFKAGDLPAVPHVSINNYRDGLTTRMPWGLTTANSATASIFNYSFIDYTGVESNWNFDAMPAPETIETGTYEGEYFPAEEFDSNQFKARIRNIGKAQRTADNRYGYTSFTTYFDIVYDGQLAYDLIAGLGMYFINTNDSAKFNTYNPDTIQNCEYAYLGEMDASGYTTCRFIHGEELGKYEGWNGKGGYVNVDFDPNKNPGGDDDESDSVSFGGVYGGAGAFCSLYIMNQTELVNLRSWLSGFISEETQNRDKIPMGTDLMSQIISLSEFPIQLTGRGPKLITFRYNGTKEDWLGPETPYRGYIKSGVEAIATDGITIEYDLGSVEIPRYWRNNNVPFLDFDTQIECYVPFCGVFGLDTQTVMGKVLHCKMYVSPTTGQCNSIVYTDSNGILNPVAYGSGVMSAQLPLSNNQWGQFVAAAYNQRMQISQMASNQSLTLGEMGVGGAFLGKSSSLDQSIMGFMIGNESKGLSGDITMHTQKQLVKPKLNSIGTTFSGGFGSAAAWSLPFTPYVKIIRPNVQIPDNYSHTFAIPQVRTKKIGDCSGLTICINPDVSSIGTATNSERAMITSILSAGVIV